MKAKQARKFLAEAIELLSTADYDGIRAHNIHAYEDLAVRNLCESVGYGAVMDSAARQWYLKMEAQGLRGAGHTIGHSAGVIKEFLKRVNESEAL